MNKTYNYIRVDLKTIKHVHLHCECCGEDLIDEVDLKDVYEKYDINGNFVSYIRKITSNGKSHWEPYIESVKNQWLIKGKQINGIKYYRKICWNCYKDEIEKNVDIAKKARKGKWYGRIFKNGFEPPPSFTSANSTFKYLFDVPQEELDKAKKKLATASKEYWINKLGKVEGAKHYDAICKRQAYTASAEYFIKEHGMNEDQVRHYNLNRACTKDNFIKRYGDKIGLEKWNEYCEYERYAGKKLEYFIDKYGEIEGHKKYSQICKAKALTLNNFIRKYGEKIGKLKYEHYVKVATRTYSDVALTLFKKIDESNSIYRLLSEYATKNDGEKYIEYLTENTSKIYYPDFSFKNKIIEFYGDYWHANPIKYKASDIMNNNYSASEIWKSDNERISNLKDLGYKVLVIWENDYANNPELILSKCIKFLTTKI